MKLYRFIRKKYGRTVNSVKANFSYSKDRSPNNESNI